MNNLGCRLDPNGAGLFDLTITRDGVPMVVIKSITAKCAAAIFERRLEEEHG